MRDSRWEAGTHARTRREGRRREREEVEKSTKEGGGRERKARGKRGERGEREQSVRASVVTEQSGKPSEAAQQSANSNQQ